MSDANIQKEIVKKINQMSDEEQRQVLQFANNLVSSQPKKSPGHFLDLVGTLDTESAQEMLRVIEEDCERIDPNGP